MALLLDTHIWTWLVEDAARLSKANATHIEKAGFGNLAVSAVSVWELAMLVHYGKMALDPNVHAWTEESLRKLGLAIIPLDASIALESYALPGTFHKDPADRVIVATARQKGLTLITQDKALLAYAKKGHVKVAP